MLDQPLGFVAALRMLLDSWMRNESAEGSSEMTDPVTSRADPTTAWVRAQH